MERHSSTGSHRSSAELVAEPEKIELTHLGRLTFQVRLRCRELRPPDPMKTFLHKAASLSAHTLENSTTLPVQALARQKAAKWLSLRNFRTCCLHQKHAFFWRWTNLRLTFLNFFFLDVPRALSQVTKNRNVR